MPTIEEELQAAKTRLGELSQMLNNHMKDASFRVENERDACERAIQFLAEQATDPKEKEAFETAVKVVHARRDPAVQFVQECAYGTVLGEFVSMMVKQAVERETAPREVTVRVDGLPDP